MNDTTQPDPFLSHLDDLKRRRNWGDAELADQVGLPNRQYLAKIRKGEKQVPYEVRIKAWDLLGYAMTRDMVLSLMPTKFATRLRAADNKRNGKSPLSSDDKKDT